jgi:hypothetical protein
MARGSANNFTINISINGAGTAQGAQQVNAQLNGILRNVQQFAQQGNRHLQQFNQGLARTIVQAHLMTRALESMMNFVKSFSLDSALYAARVEQLGIALHSVADANNIARGAVDSLVVQLKKMNITTEDSRQQLARLIAADIEYSKAVEIARTAQNLGRVAGISSAEAFERLSHAIITAQPRMLRMLGLNVSFEQTYEKLAKRLNTSTLALTEEQKANERVNATLKAGANYAGVYADSLGTVGGRLFQLDRLVKEAKLSVGDQLKQDLDAPLAGLEKFLTWVAENGKTAASVLQYIGIGIGAIAVAIGSFSGVIPGLATISGVIVGLISLMSKFGAQWRELKDAWEMDKRSHMSDEELAKEAEELLLKGGGRAEGLNRLTQKAIEYQRKQIETNAPKVSDELYRHMNQAERRARTFMADSAASELGGVAKLRLEAQKLKDDLSTYIDNTGKIQHFNLRPDIVEMIDRGLASRIAAEMNKMRDEIKRMQSELATEEYRTVAQITERTKDMRLEGIDFQVAAEIRGKREAEEEKLKIEQEYLLRARDMDVAEIKRKSEAEIALFVAQEKRKGTDPKIVAEQVRVRRGIASEEIERTLNTADVAIWAAGNRQRTEWALRDKAYGRETRDIVWKTEEDALSIKRQHLEAEKQMALENTSTINARTLDGKIRLEDQKLAIEQDYLTRSAALEIASIDMRMQHEIERARDTARREGVDPSARIDAIIKDFGQQAEAVQATWEVGMTTAGRKRALAVADAIQSQNKTLFDNLKQSADRVFDAMLSKSKSVWEAMGNALKTAFLTAFKEIVTSQIAKYLFQLLTGQKMAFANPGSAMTGGPGKIGGFLGSIGLGSIPLFAQASAGGSASAAPASQMVQQAMTTMGGGIAAPLVGGASPAISGNLQAVASSVNGGVIYGAGPGGATASTSASAGGQIAGAGSGIGTQAVSRWGGAAKGMMFMLGTMLAIDGAKRGSAAGAVETMLGGALLGYSVAPAGAGMLGAAVGAQAGLGIGLMSYGWHRGGKVGAGFSVGGGALAGAAIGSIVPGIGTAIGAAIGAGVGAIGSVISYLKGGAEREVVKKVKQRFGITIDKSMTKQIVEIAKSQYAGNVDVALNSSQVIDILQLYAMATGQKFPLRNDKPYASFFSQVNGQLYQNPGYFNGQSYAFTSSLPTLGGSVDSLISPSSPFRTTGGSASDATPLIVQLDGPATTAVLSGIAVETVGNPTVLGPAMQKTNASSYNRMQNAALALSPASVYK